MFNNKDRKLVKDSNSGRKIPNKILSRINKPLEEKIIINSKLFSSGITIPFAKQDPESETLRCMYTLEFIRDSFPVGIPVIKNKKLDSNKNEINVYHCIDVFSSFEAAYSELLHRLKLGNNNIYKNSEQYLKEIFNEYYPGKQLKTLPNKYLLEIFNGPFSYDQFNENASKMENAKENFVFVPLKHEICFTTQEKSNEDIIFHD